jgi:cytochrome c2
MSNPQRTIRQSALHCQRSTDGWLYLICMAVLGIDPQTVRADGTAGRNFFREQCTVCHTAEADDNGGAQGPSLAGLYGRPAAS